MLSIDKFLEYLRSELNRSQRTVENYREDLKLFEQYARNLSEYFTWESVDSDMIRNWMEHMIDAGNMFIKAMEDMSKADRKIRTQGFDTLIAK